MMARKTIVTIPWWPEPGSQGTICGSLPGMEHQEKRQWKLWGRVDGAEVNLVPWITCGWLCLFALVLRIEPRGELPLSHMPSPILYFI